MKLKIINNVPKTLYHATYKPLLNKIKTLGLGNTKRTNWQDSKAGVVYLSEDPYVAESYAETAEEVPETWLDEIVILQIDTTNLNVTDFFIDRNNLNADTIEYHGIIPSEYISLY